MLFSAATRPSMCKKRKMQRQSLPWCIHRVWKEDYSLVYVSIFTPFFAAQKLKLRIGLHLLILKAMRADTQTVLCCDEFHSHRALFSWFKEQKFSQWKKIFFLQFKDWTILLTLEIKKNSDKVYKVHHNYIYTIISIKS